MAKSKPKSKNPFAGRWRIISMSAWEQDFIDEEEEGYFEFVQKGGGELHFGYVHGHIDCSNPTSESRWRSLGTLDMKVPFACAGTSTEDSGTAPFHTEVQNCFLIDHVNSGPAAMARHQPVSCNFRSTSASTRHRLAG